MDDRARMLGVNAGLFCQGPCEADLHSFTASFKVLARLSTNRPNRLLTAEQHLPACDWPGGLCGGGGPLVLEHHRMTILSKGGGRSRDQCGSAQARRGMEQRGPGCHWFPMALATRAASRRKRGQHRRLAGLGRGLFDGAAETSPNFPFWTHPRPKRLRSLQQPKPHRQSTSTTSILGRE